jgi:DNA adenine methylase
MPVIECLGSRNESATSAYDKVQNLPSIAFTSNGKKYLVDVFSSSQPVTPDFLIITKPSTVFFRSLPLIDKPTTIFYPDMKGNETIKKLSKNEWTEAVPLGKEFMPDGIDGPSMTFFEVFHNKHISTAGVRIEFSKTTVVCIPNVKTIPQASKHFVYGADLLVMDGSSFKTDLEDHVSIKNVIEKWKGKFKCTYLAFTNLGEETLEKLTEVKEFLKGRKAVVLYDGATIKIEGMGVTRRLQRQIFCSPGGKYYMAKKLTKLIPPHEKYVEPFAGAAAVFFDKKPSKEEVLNDNDWMIENAYRVVKNVTPDELDKLKQMDWTASKERFKELKDAKPSGSKLTDFYNFMYVVRHSFGGDRDSFGYSDRPQDKFIERLPIMKERLGNTVIEKSDALACIERHDGKNSFFLIDPPYPESWRGKGGAMAYDYGDLVNLREKLQSLKGKFILTLGSDPKSIAIFKGHNFKMKKMATRRTIDNRGIRPVKDSEFDILVMNYEPRKFGIYNLGIDRNSGIYLVAPHAKRVWTGEKTLIVKSKSFPGVMNKPLYYCDRKACYGVLKLTKITPIGIAAFKQRTKEHMISEQEREKWWPNAVKLFAYNFEIEENFDQPRDYVYKQGYQTFMNGVELLNSFGIEMIKDPLNYVPSTIDTSILKDDWRIVCSWYSTKKKGKEFTYSIETIINVAKLIHSELLKRGITFHPENMKPMSMELYGIITKPEVVAVQ